MVLEGGFADSHHDAPVDAVDSACEVARRSGGRPRIDSRIPVVNGPRGLAPVLRFCGYRNYFMSSWSSEADEPTLVLQRAHLHPKYPRNVARNESSIHSPLKANGWSHRGHRKRTRPRCPIASSGKLSARNKVKPSFGSAKVVVTTSTATPLATDTRDQRSTVHVRLGFRLLIVPSTFPRQYGYGDVPRRSPHYSPVYAMRRFGWNVIEALLWRLAPSHDDTMRARSHEPSTPFAALQTAGSVF